MDRVRADVEDRIASSEERPGRAPAGGSQPRLLIAEDDRTLREGLRLTLAGEGYRVSAVGSGQDALDALRESRFDIVITDLHLEPVSGMDVLGAARRSTPPAAVVVMTGDASLENSLAVIRAGACDCLAKPFSATRLRALLERAHRLSARAAEMDAGEVLVTDFERVYLHRLVQDAGGSLDRAARMARVDRDRLQRLIEKHALTTAT